MLQPIRQRKVLVAARFQVCRHCQKMRREGATACPDEASRLGSALAGDGMHPICGLCDGVGMLCSIRRKCRRGGSDMVTQGSLMC